MHKRPRLRLVVDNTKPGNTQPGLPASRPDKPRPAPYDDRAMLASLAEITRIARHYTREIDRIDRKAEAIFQAEIRALENAAPAP